MSFKFSRGNQRVWTEQFGRLFKEDIDQRDFIRAYMEAWDEGAKQMLDFLQQEASEGKFAALHAQYEDIMETLTVEPDRSDFEEYCRSI